MDQDDVSIRYASGEIARIGDRVIDDVWDAVVEDVVATAADMARWGLEVPGLMLVTAEAGLVFESHGSLAWSAIRLIGRAT